MRSKAIALLVSTATFIVLTSVPSGAQQTTGEPGSPSATTTIDGHVLPPPPSQFGGEVELNAAQSKAYWPARVVSPKGAPNILLIITDDVGFGESCWKTVIALRGSARST
jgi:arylsulfatase